MAHLVQKCCDDCDILMFDTMAQYLRENSKNVENEPETRKRIMNTTSEDNSVVSQRYSQKAFGVI